MTSITAPAHPHATGVAVYPAALALFFRGDWMKGVTHQIVLLATLRGFVCRSVNLSVFNCKYVCLGRYTPLPPPLVCGGIVAPDYQEVSSLGGDGSLSDVLGLNYIQISNFSITGSGASIKDVILRHQTSFKLILDARFGFPIENYIRFS